MSECPMSSTRELALTKEAAEKASVAPDKEFFLRNHVKLLDASALPDPSDECSICQIGYLSQSHYKLITLKKSSIRPPQKGERTEAQLRITIRDSAATIEAKVRDIFNIIRPEENSLVFRDSRFCSFYPSYENFTHGRVFQVRVTPYAPWSVPILDCPKDKEEQLADDERQLDQSDQPVQLPCSHVFGETCIRQWLESANTCPICRCVLYQKDIEEDDDDEDAEGEELTREEMMALLQNTSSLIDWASYIGGKFLFRLEQHSFPPNRNHVAHPPESLVMVT